MFYGSLYGAILLVRTRAAFFLNFINLPLLVAGEFTFGHGELMYCCVSKGSILPRSEA